MDVGIEESRKQAPVVDRPVRVPAESSIVTLSRPIFRRFPRMKAWFQRGGAILMTAGRIGFRAARERGRAVVALWLSAALVVVAYYLVPGVSSALEPVGRWQCANGHFASFVLCAAFCGLVPYAVYLIRGEKGRCSPLTTATAQAVWCGLCGVVCGCFFSVQGRWFGCGHDLATVLKKVFVDQFGWSVLVIVPANAVFYAVLSGGWRMRNERVSFGVFVKHAYLPSLIMNWFVGIPSNCAVYAFPMDLQIPVLGLLSSAWAVICVGLGAHSGCAIRASSSPSAVGR